MALVELPGANIVGELAGKVIDVGRDLLSEPATEPMTTGPIVGEKKEEPSETPSETPKVEETNTPFEADNFEFKIETPKEEDQISDAELDDIDFEKFLEEAEQEQEEKEVEQPEINVETNENGLTDEELDSLDLGEIFDVETNETVDLGPRSENENAYVKDYDTVELANIPNVPSEEEKLELDLPTNGNITEQDVLNQTGERPNEEQLETINEVANKDADGEIELDESLDPKEVADSLNEMEDNGSDITEEEVELEQKDDDGDSETIKKGLQLLSDDDFNKFAEESELETRYNKQKSQADFHWDKNIFGDTVYNTEDELKSELNKLGYKDNDYDTYIGKDDQGYYFWAVPSFTKEKDDEAIERSKTTPASELSKSELGVIYKQKRQEEKDRKEAAKLKNLPTEQIEQRIKEWNIPTPEEWERSYNNGTVGHLRSSMAEKTRYVKELAVRDFVENKDITDEEKETLRKELASKGSWTSLKERYPNYLIGKEASVKKNDYEARLNLAYRGILEKRLENENAVQKVKTEQQIETINEDIENTVFDSQDSVDINAEDVFVKDTDGNLKEVGELDNNLYELTEEEVKDSGIDTTDINPDTDKVMGDVYGNTTVITNPNGWDEYDRDYSDDSSVDPAYSDEETYLDETKLDNKWTKWNDGTFGRKIQDNEWQLYGLEKDEYETALVEEAKQQAEKLGLREGTYDIKVEDNEVKIVPSETPKEEVEQKKKKKRLRLPRLAFGGKVELNETNFGKPTEITETNETTPNETFTTEKGNSITSGSEPSGTSVSSSDINDSYSAGKVDTSIPSVDTNTSKVSGRSLEKVGSEETAKGAARQYKLPNRTTAASKTAEQMRKSKSDARDFNREQNKDTGIKSKYRRVGSKSKQLSLSKLHNDVSMMTLIDKIVQKVLKYYHSWTKSGDYWYFNGETGKIRYKVGGTVEIRFKGETNWASIKTLSRQTGISGKLQALLDEIS